MKRARETSVAIGLCIGLVAIGALLAAMALVAGAIVGVVIFACWCVDVVHAGWTARGQR